MRRLPSTAKVRIAPDRRVAYSMGLRHGIFGMVPALVGAFVVYALVRRHGFGADFAAYFWPAGHRVLNGLSPYVNANSPEVATGSAYYQPAVAAVLMAPLSLLPRTGGAAVFAALNMLAVIGALRVAGVRDWRVYGPALLWAPVISGWQTANITLLLALGIAVAWRYRENAVVCGAAVGIIVSAKIFLWPLALWLLGTRRYRATGCAMLAGVAANAAGGAILGFNEVPRYLHLLHAASAAEERRGYSIFALALHHGASRLTAVGVGFMVAAAVGGVCFVLGRRGRDHPALSVSVACCLLATPVIWLHYFAILLVPFAIARPRMSLLWGLPLLMLFPVTDPADWQVGVMLAMTTALVLSTIRPGPMSQRSVSRRAQRSRYPDPLLTDAA